MALVGHEGYLYRHSLLIMDLQNFFGLRGGNSGPEKRELGTRTEVVDSLVAALIENGLIVHRPSIDPEDFGKYSIDFTSAPTIPEVYAAIVGSYQEQLERLTGLHHIDKLAFPYRDGVAGAYPYMTGIATETGLPVVSINLGLECPNITGPVCEETGKVVFEGENMVLVTDRIGSGYDLAKAAKVIRDAEGSVEYVLALFSRNYDARWDLLNNDGVWVWYQVSEKELLDRDAIRKDELVFKTTGPAFNIAVTSGIEDL